MDVYGWDTVSALSLDAANRALSQSSDQLITDFEMTGDSLSTPYILRGKLGPWRIAPGGSGSILRLAVPVESGTISGGSGSEIGLDGSIVVVDVSLELLPVRGGGGQDLVFALREAGRVGDRAEPGVVTPVVLITSAATESRLGAVGMGLVANGVAEVLADQAANVSFVFASVNLVRPDSGGWLTPVSSAFVYLETRAGLGYLCVLSVTDGRGVAGLQHTVDPELFAAGGDLAFAISEDLFLTGMVRPALPQVFGGGADPSCFAYDEDRHVIVAARRFTTEPIKVVAIRYTPRVTSLQLGVVGGQLTLAVSGNCDLKAGISMNWWISSQYAMGYDEADQRIYFSDGMGTRSGHSAHIPWWFWASGLLVETITKVVVNEVIRRLTETLSHSLASTGLGALVVRDVEWCGVEAAPAPVSTSRSNAS